MRWCRPAHSRVTRSLQWLAREMRAWSVRATQLEMQRYLEQHYIYYTTDLLRVDHITITQSNKTTAPSS